MKTNEETALAAEESLSFELDDLLEDSVTTIDSILPENSRLAKAAGPSCDSDYTDTCTYAVCCRSSME